MNCIHIVCTEYPVQSSGFVVLKYVIAVYCGLLVTVTN